MHGDGRCGRSCAILGCSEATTAMATVVRMNFIVIQIVDDGCFLRLERKMRSGVRSWHHLFAVASVANTELRVPCRRYVLASRSKHGSITKRVASGLIITFSTRGFLSLVCLYRDLCGRNTTPFAKTKTSSLVAATLPDAATNPHKKTEITMAEVVAERQPRIDDYHRAPVKRKHSDSGDSSTDAEEGETLERTTTAATVESKQKDFERDPSRSKRSRLENYGSQERTFANNLIRSNVYIPPAKRFAKVPSAEGQGAVSLENSGLQSPPDVAEQWESWEHEKRLVIGTINRLNASTIKVLLHDLFSQVNLLRMRGILTQSLLQAVTTGSSTYLPVYAAFLSVISSKLPEIGELCIRRGLALFRQAYVQRNKTVCLHLCLWIGHLLHQGVIHELLVLQLLSLLLDHVAPTNDSIEIAVELLRTTGYTLLQVSPTGVRAILSRIRSLLHEGSQHLHKKTCQQMESLLEARKQSFRVGSSDGEYSPIPAELDLIDIDNDQVTLEISLDDDDDDAQGDGELSTSALWKKLYLDYSRYQLLPAAEYQQHKEEWKQIRNELLGTSEEDDDSSDNDGDSTTSGGSGSDDEEAGQDPASSTAIVPADSGLNTIVPAATTIIQDLTENDLIHLRRQIYLTIMSSATFEECAHKLSQVSIPIGKEEELINMIIECCSQERTFMRYYGLVASRFCMLPNSRWLQAFIVSFAAQYTTIHRLETNKLRNVAKLFAHLLHTDSLPWSVLSVIHLNEDETTSSSRIFLKLLVQELAEAMGVQALKQRFDDGVLPLLQSKMLVLENNTTDTQNPSEPSKDRSVQSLPLEVEWYRGMFPMDNVRDTRYAINFYTSIGLGPLSDVLRDFLKIAPKIVMAEAREKQAALLVEQQLMESTATKARPDDRDDDSSSTSSSSVSSTSSSSSSSSSSSYSSSSRSSYSSTSGSSSRSSGSSSSGSYSSDSRSSDDSRRKRTNTTRKGVTDKKYQSKSSARAKGEERKHDPSKRRDYGSQKDDRDHRKRKSRSSSPPPKKARDGEAKRRRSSSAQDSDSQSTSRSSASDSRENRRRRPKERRRSTSSSRSSSGSSGASNNGKSNDRRSGGKSRTGAGRSSKK
jgi:pre-mRNA-splicing factor CWC22